MTESSMKGPTPTTLWKVPLTFFWSSTVADSLSSSSLTYSPPQNSPLELPGSLSTVLIMPSFIPLLAFLLFLSTNQRYSLES